VGWSRANKKRKVKKNRIEKGKAGREGQGREEQRREETSRKEDNVIRNIQLSQNFRKKKVIYFREPEKTFAMVPTQ